MIQKYTSKDTSINTVSAVYKNIDMGRNKIILDYGGGKYNTNAEYMLREYNSKVVVYDPYNRSKEHNEKVLDYFSHIFTDTVICSNVLNVIKEDEVILNILKHINSLMVKNGKLYIKIYERDRSGIGCETTKGWQRNQKLKDYVPFIMKAFNNRCEIAKEKDILVVLKK